MRSRKKAIALSYETGMPAPFMCAKGSDRLAGRMIALAREHGVPVVEDAALSEILYPFEIGAWVPETCYEAVAAVFVAIARMEKA